MTIVKKILSIPYILLFFILADISYAEPKPLELPDDPMQSITYWKPHAISADKDPLVAKAQDLFAILLRAWDSSRLEPNLFVVNSAEGPWAASLADGNILLSRKAIEIALSFKKDRSEHLLAFVLAHELAHQRSNDLWHQRFFRLIGASNPALKKQMVNKFKLDEKLIEDIEQKEAQADHDGLIMMATVGFDPYQIIDKKDFFTAWVENIWQNSCSSQDKNSHISHACKDAKNRALRARAQLNSVATQATLYELGVQSFIASHYKKARRYFTIFGRDYPNRAVLSAIGLTHFAEALSINNKLTEKHNLKKPAFYYPLMLDATVTATSFKSEPVESSKRSSVESIIKKQQQKIHKSIELAINHFEKAIQLEPNHKKTYLLIALSYLLDGNTFMTRGVIQGKYIPKFGTDNAASLLLTMTGAMEGNKETITAFNKLLDNIKKDVSSSPIPKYLLIYTTYYNSAAYAEYLGNHKKADNLWKELAKHGKTTGNGLLFRLALGQLANDSLKKASFKTAPKLNGFRIGDKFPPKLTKADTNSEFWIEGEKYKVSHLTNGSRFVTGPEDKIIGAWQDSGKESLNGLILLGDDADRPIKSLGIPDRHLHMVSGEYLAYDDYGVAVHIINDKVAGWFLYAAN